MFGCAPIRDILLTVGREILEATMSYRSRLIPLEDGGFRVGADEACLERIRFEVIVENQALRANFSCGEYYRVFKY